MDEVFSWLYPFIDIFQEKSGKKFMVIDNLIIMKESFKDKVFFL
jgi:hypothetical protein